MEISQGELDRPCHIIHLVAGINIEVHFRSDKTLDVREYSFAGIRLLKVYLVV